jgi:hypothetical protein
MIDMATLPTVDTVAAAIKEQRSQERCAEIAGMRELIDLLEEHPEVPLPPWNWQSIFVETKEDLVRFRRLLGCNDKDSCGEFLQLRRKFGPIILNLTIEKEKTCRKVQTGTVQLPAEPAKPAMPAREVPVYEWICAEPWLAPTGGPTPSHEEFCEPSGTVVRSERVAR